MRTEKALQGCPQGQHEEMQHRHQLMGDHCPGLPQMEEVSVARISAFRNSTPTTGRGKASVVERPCRSPNQQPRTTRFI